MQQNTERLKVFTWHVHGSYLYYLSHADCKFYVPFTKDRKIAGYGGRIGPFPWGGNLYEIEADKVKNYQFDCVLFQSKQNYLEDQYKILSDTQRQLPQLYLEHDPPRKNPTDTRHPASDSDILIVHVTPFNKLMWNNGTSPTVVIDHGVVIPPDVRYKGSLDKGVVVINNIALRGRRLGYDIFEYVRKYVPLDIVGMGTAEIGGVGEIPHNTLPEFLSSYRFFFNPIRYTSLGLSVIEAMMVGLPIVGLATTEMVTVVKNGSSGFWDTNIDELISQMHLLLKNPDLAKKMGQKARQQAEQRFNISRFAKDWEKIFNWAVFNKQKQLKVCDLKSRRL